MSEKNWREIVEQAEHYITIGQTDVYVQGPDAPWEYATGCKPGGTHRMDIDSTVWFEAEHPCGLTFKWTLQLESSAADYKSYYEIDTAAVKSALQQLSPTGKAKLADYLAVCADKVYEQGEKYEKIAARQFGDAEVLRRLSREGAES